MQSRRHTGKSVLERGDKAGPEDPGANGGPLELWPLNTWCHGDFHGGNAMRRFGATRGCVLIDLALVHPGHWLEDALYLERQFWAKPELLHGIKPVTVLGRLHRERGMPDPGYVDLANIRRVLMASTALSFVSAEGHPKYLHACLETVEKLLPQLPH